VGNTKSLGLDDWRTEIGAAQAAGIDAFALNMASGDATNDIALRKAFTAADDMGFQLLFLFGYAGNGPCYDKNWLWRGDDMWFQRWQQATSLDRLPDFIQIILWNNYGESHYISPLDDRQ
jgi:hypothetical protein